MDTQNNTRSKKRPARVVFYLLRCYLLPIDGDFTNRPTIRESHETGLSGTRGDMLGDYLVPVCIIDTKWVDMSPLACTSHTSRSLASGPLTRPYTWHNIMISSALKPKPRIPHQALVGFKAYISFSGAPYQRPVPHRTTRSDAEFPFLWKNCY